MKRDIKDMKKYLLVFLLIWGLGISTKGMDPLCVKNHGSVILNDQKWHTLKYEDFDGYCISDIAIRQTSEWGDYEVKDANEDAVSKFNVWLNTYMLYFKEFSEDTIVNTVHDGSNYIVNFRASKFVPNVDNIMSFIGIDIFK